jgi:Lon protease-like protein
MGMKSSNDFPAVLPVFPLPGALLLPRTPLPLHIFEPRYLQMVEDCMKTSERLIVMAQPRGGAAGDRLNVIGCAGRLTGFNETDDGRYMITLTGISRCRIGAEVDGFSPYRRAQVDWSGFDRDFGAPERDAGLDRPSLLNVLRRYFSEEELDVDWDGLAAASDEVMINAVSMLCPFGPEDKQALLEAPSLSTRRETLVTLMEFALRGGNDEEMM